MELSELYEGPADGTLVIRDSNGQLAKVSIERDDGSCGVDWMREEANAELVSTRRWIPIEQIF